MYRRILSLLTILLAAVALPLSAAPAPSDATGCAPNVSLADTPTYASQDGERHIAMVNSKIAVETLTGHRAVEYFQKLRAEKPARFKEAGKFLAQKGYKPTNTVTVFRTLRITEAQLRQGIVPPAVPQRASTTVTSSEGEVVFWSWDDGDDGTWEGSTYVERYSDGAYTNSDSQSDIQTSDYFEIWSDVTSSGGGGDGPGDDPIAVSFEPKQDANQVRFAVAGGPNAALMQQGALNPRLVLDGFDWQGFLSCSIGGCSGCAVSCAFTGPTWPGCFGPCCGAVVVACAIQELILMI